MSDSFCSWFLPIARTRRIFQSHRAMETDLLGQVCMCVGRLACLGKHVPSFSQRGRIFGAVESAGDTLKHVRSS